MVITSEMSILPPVTLEIVACFILSTSLLYKYADFVNQNVITIVAVFVSWFFSFMVIFLLPADISSTAYLQCLADYNTTITNSTTTNDNSTNIDIQSTTTNNNYNNITHNQLTDFNNITAQGQHVIQQNATNIAYITTINQSPSDIIICTIPWNYVTFGALSKLWRFIYWSSQFLTWIILPLMQSYSMAGDFTSWDKFKSALRANLIYYSSYGAIFLILLVYVVFKNGLDFDSLRVILITSSNTWGLILLVVLLGYGLVELPRYLIRRSRCANSLNQLYYQVARLNAEKCEAEEKLDDSLEEIQQAFTALNDSENHTLRRCLDLIVDKCPPDWKRRSIAFRRQNAAANSSSHINLNGELNLDKMIRLHRKVIRSVHFYRQTNCRWTQLTREVVEWEDVARCQAIDSSHNKVFQPSIPRRTTQSIYDSIKYSIFTPRVEWYWKCSIRAWLLRGVGFAMAALSLAVVWSELTFSIHQPVLSIFASVVDMAQNNQNYFLMEIFSIISIGYLAICAFYTVFKMRIFNIYYLATNHQTNEYSLLFSGMLLCRLTSPLCLNYLCLVQRDSHIIKQRDDVNTAFTSIMGHLDLISIVSNGLNIFLPLCISAICLALYFNLGTHLLHNLGFERFIEGEEMTEDWIQNGRELVKRERGKLLRSLEAGNSNNSMNNGTKDSATSPSADGKYTEYLGTLRMDGSSRDSLTSTSSGFSRSSLIPKTARDSLTDTVTNIYSTGGPRAGTAIRDQDDPLSSPTSAYPTTSTIDFDSNTNPNPKNFFNDF